MSFRDSSLRGAYNCIKYLASSAGGLHGAGTPYGKWCWSGWGWIYSAGTREQWRSIHLSSHKRWERNSLKLYEWSRRICGGWGNFTFVIRGSRQVWRTFCLQFNHLELHRRMPQEYIQVFAKRPWCSQYRYSI